jgi:hypothetical protein
MSGIRAVLQVQVPPQKIKIKRTVRTVVTYSTRGCYPTSPAYPARSPQTSSTPYIYIGPCDHFGFPFLRIFTWYTEGFGPGTPGVPSPSSTDTMRSVGYEEKIR